MKIPKTHKIYHIILCNVVILLAIFLVSCSDVETKDVETDIPEPIVKIKGNIFVVHYADECPNDTIFATKTVTYGEDGYTGFVDANVTEREYKLKVFNYTIRKIELIEYGK